MKNRRVWLGLGVLLAVNYLLLFGQTIISNWQWRHLAPVSFLFPEMRYWVQGLVVFLPFVPMLLLKFRHGKKMLVILFAALAIHAVCFLVKAHVPGTRRNQYVAACDWAVETIRADYKGPKEDAEPFFSWLEYHPLVRPCVEAHASRVSYLLGGRAASLAGCGIVDIPDYIVDEVHKVRRDWWTVAEYEKLAERKFGKRNFVIYKRIK